MSLDKYLDVQIEAEVYQAFEGVAVAASSLNINAYMAFFDKKKFTALNFDGCVFHELSDFESYYRQQIHALEKYNSLEFTKVKITVLNRCTAILVNEYIAEVVLKSGDSLLAGGAGTQVWSKASGGWKLVNVSASVKTNG
ncbi:nuclear transport factor 2 family protein [Alteromonas facilis]|uniref:nuclear transport factor 2 family protein n=1 Tax=Alteromonas facilis TaxID=2048004 RepID=UPI0013DD7294|nr:nuclear transport factor 2 family protein [Alteromonas facilis]